MEAQVAEVMASSLLRGNAALSATAEQLPELPPEVWQAIARATLAACGCSYGAWLQLRTVSRDWWHGLKGTNSLFSAMLCSLSSLLDCAD